MKVSKKGEYFILADERHRIKLPITNVGKFCYRNIKEKECLDYFTSAFKTAVDNGFTEFKTDTNYWKWEVEK